MGIFCSTYTLTTIHYQVLWLRDRPNIYGFFLFSRILLLKIACLDGRFLCSVALQEKGSVLVLIFKQKYAVCVAKFLGISWANND